jgi:hypothetical protein
VPFILSAVRGNAEAEERRLLRFLQLQHRAMPANPIGAGGLL